MDYKFSETTTEVNSFMMVGVCEDQIDLVNFSSQGLQRGVKERYYSDVYYAGIAIDTILMSDLLKDPEGWVKYLKECTDLVKAVTGLEPSLVSVYQATDY